MGNIIIFISFFLFTTAGMVLIKLGSRASENILFTLPILDFKLSVLSLIGFILYGISFLLYATLLTRYDLSFLNPTTVGITSVLIFISAAVIFGEVITGVKVLALLLIISGVVLINVGK